MAHPLHDPVVLHRSLHAGQRNPSYMLTQITFDPEAIVSWLRSVRRQRVTLLSALARREPVGYR